MCSSHIITAIEYLISNHIFASTEFSYINKQDFHYYNGQYYELGAEEYIAKMLRKQYPKRFTFPKAITKIIEKVQELISSCYIRSPLFD